MRPLLVPVPIHQDESLQSLVVRANEANHYESVAVTIGSRAVGRSDKQLLCACSRGDVSADELATRTHNRLADIERAQLRLAAPVVGRETDQYLVINRWRQCPECFRQAPFHRRLWALAYVTACPVHGTELIDACSACGSALDLGGRLSDACQSCGTMLPTGKSASSSALALSRAAESGLAAHTAGSPKPLADLHNRLAMAIVLTEPKYLSVRSRISPHLMDLEQMAPLVDQIGCVALSDETLGDYAGRVVRELRARWPHLPGAALVTVRRIADMAGAAMPEPLRSLLDGAPNAGGSNEDAETPFLVPPSEWEVPSEIAAEILGVSGFVLRRLLKTELVSYRLRSEDKSLFGGLRLFALDSLNTLMADLHAVAEEIDPWKEGKLPRLWDFKIDDIIPKALSGYIRVYRAEGEGLAAFRIRYQETQRARQRQALPAGFVTVQQAAERLLTYRAVVDRLMDIGKLNTMPWHGGTQRLIDIGSLEAFDRQFVLVGALAKQHGLNSTNLSEKLQSFGVEAVMGPDIDGGLVKVFWRKDVVGVDFRQVNRLKGYQTKTGRRRRTVQGISPN